MGVKYGEHQWSIKLIGYTVSNDTIIKNFLETKEFLNP
jgi:hypothetical protein